jgi:hypothetical protein
MDERIIKKIVNGLRVYFCPKTNNKIETVEIIAIIIAKKK